MQSPERITVLADSFEGAAFEYHRKRMAEKGYRVERKIDEAVFELVTPEGQYESIHDDQPLFAITFVKN